VSILITGGTGFIGAQVVHLLLEKGEKDLIVFDINPSTRLLSDVEDQIEIICGDLGNFSHVLNAVKFCKPKAIYHLGGMLSVPSDADHAASFRANALGTFHVLESTRLFHVPQVLFSSTIGTYGQNIRENRINDYTLQRPQLFYGCTKVFCENMGLFYKRKYGLDYRGVRYPAIVGPGVKTPGLAQFTSWVIEESAKGNPYDIYVRPETKIPIMYFKDAAEAIVKLAEPTAENIQMGNYVLAGSKPASTAQELADAVKKRIPDARISFEPNLELNSMIDNLVKPIDDSVAEKEWGWRSEYDLERMVDDFLMEMREHPELYD
jgi:threonine 3-dehydrogenase